jgi:hypothetical protein
MGSWDLDQRMTGMNVIIPVMLSSSDTVNLRNAVSHRVLGVAHWRRTSRFVVPIQMRSSALARRPVCSDILISTCNDFETIRTQLTAQITPIMYYSFCRRDSQGLISCPSRPSTNTKRRYLDAVAQCDPTPGNDCSPQRLPEPPEKLS